MSSWRAEKLEALADFEALACSDEALTADWDEVLPVERARVPRPAAP